jgi:hypothetical protein
MKNVTATQLAMMRHELRFWFKAYGDYKPRPSFPDGAAKAIAEQLKKGPDHEQV